MLNTYFVAWIHMGWVRRVVMLSADMLSIGEFLLIDR